jgi:small ligand-binding sensory domain FIST
MNRFSTASTIVTGYYQESIVQQAAAMLRMELGQNPTFAVVFATPHYMDHLHDFVEVIRVHGHVPVLVGASAWGLVGRTSEIEGSPGFSIMFFAMSSVRVTPVEVEADSFQKIDHPKMWAKWSKVAPDDVKLWLTFIDPFQFPIEDWLDEWNQAYPGVPIFGGLASGNPQEQKATVFHNDKIVSGALALALDGDFGVQCLVSQGCRPLGSRPALEVLNTVYEELPSADKKIAQGHIFAGLAMSEYVEDFKSGDFLIRNIFGADPHTGAVSIGAFPRVGQTLQYQLRDAQTASDDFRNLLLKASEDLGGCSPFGALICTCTGRGEKLFKSPHHDAQMVDEIFPGISLAGFFGNGEIGPVGERSYAHGYSVSVVLFYEI